MPASKLRLLASVFPEPVKADTEDDGAPTVEVGLVVLEPAKPEPPDVLLGGMGIAVATELPEGLEPLEELFPPAAPSDGVMFSGAFFASSLNVSMVRDWFLAGLVRKLALIESSNHAVEYIRIDHTDHAILAMISLRAIEPYRLRVIDHNSIRWQICVAGLDGHEARKETRHFRLDIVDGHTGIIECGFNDGVFLNSVSTHNGQGLRPTAYLWIELKLYQRSLCSFKVVGREREISLLVGDLDSVHMDRASWCCTRACRWRLCCYGCWRRCRADTRARVTSAGSTPYSITRVTPTASTTVLGDNTSGQQEGGCECSY